MIAHYFESTLVANFLRLKSSNIGDCIELLNLVFLKHIECLFHLMGMSSGILFALIYFHAVLLKIESIDSFGRSTFKVLFKVDIGL